MIALGVVAILIGLGWLAVLPLCLRRASQKAIPQAPALPLCRAERTGRQCRLLLGHLGPHQFPKA